MLKIGVGWVLPVITLSEAANDEDVTCDSGKFELLHSCTLIDQSSF
jgi:hypothetical protein